MKKLLHTTKKHLRVLVALAIVLSVGAGLATQQPKTVQAAVSSSTPCVGSAAPAGWHHVIVLMFENKVYNEVINNSAAPFTSALANKCATATNWRDANFNVTGGSDGGYKSKPHYFTLTSGLPPSKSPNILDDDYPDTSTVNNIYRTIRTAGKTSKTYVEGRTSLSTPCDTSNSSTQSSGSYHDPMRYYVGPGDRDYCNANDVDLSKFATDLNSGNLPSFSMIIPKNTSNMHDNSVASGDTWAQNFLNPIFDSATYKSGDTAVYYMWDEDTPIPNVLVAPSVAPGTKIGTTSHFEATRTWEDMLGLPLIGDTGQAKSLVSTVFGGGGCGTSCPPPSDTTPPTVAITSPANGTTTSATSVTVNATATDNVAVKQVEFFVNGVSKAVDTSSSYSFNWDTTSLTSGTYTINAKATDTSNNVSQTSITVNFVAPSGCTPITTNYGTATLTMNVPTAGTYHSWSRLLAPDTTNNSYYLQIDNDCPIVVGDSAIAANTWTWVDYKDGASGTKNNVNLTAGTHTVKLIGREANVGLDRVLFLSDTCTPTGVGDNCLATSIPAPTASLTSPTANQTLSGTANLTATATAGTGTTIANVEFFNGLTSLGKDTTSPYSATWDTTAEANGAYTVGAVATDALGQKSAISSVPVTILNSDGFPPTQPSNLHTTSVTSGEVKLAWTASTDNIGVTGYNIYINGALTPTATVTGTTYDDTNVSPNTGYIYQVEAIDNAGNKSTKASLGVTTPPAADTQAPSVPTGVTGTINAAQTVDLRWTASTDNVAVKDYLVRRDGTVIATVTGTSYTDSTVLPATTYSYSIIARDTSDNSSAASAAVSVTTPVVTPPTDTTKPSVPGGVTAAAPNSSQVNVSWNASTDNVGVTGYRVYRSDSTTPIATVTTTSFGDATVTAGSTYTYKVSAFDAAKNESAQSTGATVTVPQQTNNSTFSDDFEKGSGYWSPVKGTWSVVGDGTHGNVYNQQDPGDAWSTAGSTTLQDYSVEANVKPVSFITGSSPSQFAAIYGRWQDNTHWYYVVLRSTGVIELKKNVGGVYTLLASKQTTITPGTWYNVKLDMQGSKLNVSLNGQQTLSADDSSISSGKIGVGTYYAQAHFDDVKVAQSSVPVLTAFKPEADAWVGSDYPATNFGTRANLAADGSPKQSSLIRFKVSGTNGRTVTSASLLLNVTDSSYAGGKFYSVSNDWTETGVTWKNAPAVASGAVAYADLGVVHKGTVIVANLTNLIKGDGTYTVRIDTDNKDVVKYSSRESSVSPQLWVSSQYLSL